MDEEEDRNDPDPRDPESMWLKEVKCHRCYGTGEDSEGSDCIHCEGFGTLIL